MRIAISGAHGVGKTTLVEDLVGARGDYHAVPEPYWLLADEGMAFADGPTSADLETQLARSCDLILAAGTDERVVFDRCPFDFLAYLDEVSAGEGFEWEPTGKLLARVEKALAALDLVIFVPLVRPDDIAVEIEYPKLRARVDARLKTMLREDDLGLLQDSPRVLEIFGTREVRLGKVLAELP